MAAPRLNTAPLVPGQQVTLQMHYVGVQTSLSAPLIPGVPVSAVPVAPIPSVIAAGQPLGVGVGTQWLEVFTTTAAVGMGATSIPVAAQTPAVTHNAGDAVGQLVDPATPALVERTPDGTKTTLALTRLSTGVYSVSPILSQPRATFFEATGANNAQGLGQCSADVMLWTDPSAVA